MARRIHHHPTPPPWKGIRRDKDGAVLVIGKRDPALDFDLAIGEIHNASKADGDLMALASDMLAALREIPMECPHTEPHLLACWVCKAKAVIAKVDQMAAQGRANPDVPHLSTLESDGVLWRRVRRDQEGGDPVSNKTLADAMATDIIHSKADDIMVEAEHENDLTHRLAWLVRELAGVVGAAGVEVSKLRAGDGLTLRDRFAVHTPPMPKNWRPRAGLPTKPEPPTLDYLTRPDQADMIWSGFEEGDSAKGYTDDDIGREWKRAHGEIEQYYADLKTWLADCQVIRAARWPWHYADLCLSNRDGK